MNSIRLKIRTAPEAPLKALPYAPKSYMELVKLIKDRLPAMQLIENDNFVITY